MLDSKQRRTLKSLAHPLKAIVIVGKKGVTDAIVLELGRALSDHELVKVRFHEHDELADDAAKLAERAEAELVAVTGKIAILFKVNEENPRIQL